MKFLKAMLLVVVVFSLIFTVGCAARQTVQKDTPAVDASSDGAVEEATPEPVKKTGKKYIVKKGDTLWEISGMGKIYSSNFQWPLLFKANRDQIQDPDLIEVDQELDVRTDFSSSEIEEAVQKAKDTPPYRPHTSPRKKLPLKY
jgi:hypothetical protein